MSLQTAADIPILITSANSSSERRVSPAWTIGQIKSRLEPITGIPATSQRLVLKLGGSQQKPIPIEAVDEESTQLRAWPLQAYAEINVSAIGTSAAVPNYTDLSGVQKFELTPDEYAKRDDTVLNYKRQHGIGRFDPNAPTAAAATASAAHALIQARQLALSTRVRLLPANPDTDAADDRRGHIGYIGTIPELPGLEGVPWIGVALDEPTGRNDGSAPGGKRYFDAGGPKRGVFVRAERVDVARPGEEEDEFADVMGGDDGDEDEMEEI